jgi:thiol-disulfide isomerase/thioredoxin
MSCCHGLTYICSFYTIDLQFMRNQVFLLTYFCLFAFLFESCLVADTTYSEVAPGRWRGILELSPVLVQPASKKEVLTIHDQFVAGQLPFQFDVVYTDPQTFEIELINGAERIKVTDVTFGRSVRTARDTIRINFPEYQSYIIAEVRGGMMNGHWVVTTKDDYKIPFSAKLGEPYRFTNVNIKPETDLSGEWATLFDINSEKPDRAIGEFAQNGNKLLGTFRTESGDYRYLEGTVQANKFWLSCFDGSHAFLFSGKISADTLQGEFRSGTHYQTLWSAKRDPNFKLSHADSISVVSDGGSGIKFDLKATDGQAVKYPSAAFDGKVKLFTISGTWCPNCKDEQLFLKEYMQKNPELAKQISIITFSFERFKEETQVMEHLSKYREKLGITWPVVLAGKAKTEEAQRVFPSLSKVAAFPTMIIIDKKNKVHQVHTGFDGPATSKYAQFVSEFDATMKKLAAE